MRRLVIGLILLAVVVAAAAGVAHWAGPLFAGGGGPSWYTKTVYPLETPGAIRAGAARYDLDPALVAAVVYAESKFDEHARSSAGAVGLMQVLPDTANQIADQSGRGDVHRGRPGGPAHQRALRLLLPAPCARHVRRRRSARRWPRTTPAWAWWGSGSSRRTPTGTDCGSRTSRIPRRAPTSRRSSRRAGYTGKSTATASGRRRLTLTRLGGGYAAGPSPLANMCSYW